jgi:hypothetical protein
MFKLLAVLLFAFALFSCASSSGISGFVSSRVTDESQRSSVLAQISSMTTFTGDFTGFSEDLSSLIDSILSITGTTSTESSTETSETSSTETTNAATQNLAGLFGMIGAFAGSLVLFYML